MSDDPDDSGPENDTEALRDLTAQWTRLRDAVCDATGAPPLAPDPILIATLAKLKARADAFEALAKARARMRAIEGHGAPYDMAEAAAAAVAAGAVLRGMGISPDDIEPTKGGAR